MTAAGRGAWHPIGMGKKLVRPLRLAAMAAFVLAVGAAASPGAVGDALGAALVALLVAAPLVRVGFFVGRWWQIGDRRYAIVSLVLLVEIGAGALLALG